MYVISASAARLANGFSQVGDPTPRPTTISSAIPPFWAAVEKLDVPFYLTRAAAAGCAAIYEGHSWLLWA